MIRRMKRFVGLFICFLLLFAIAVPAVAQTTAANTFTCTQLAILDSVTATTKVISAPTPATSNATINGAIVAIPTGKRIRICHITYRVVQGVAAADFGLKTGTGTNCGTGTANLTPQWAGVASITETMTILYGSDGSVLVPAGKDLCFALSAAPTKAQISISYGVW